MTEDVLEVVDQDLSPVRLQLIGQRTNEGGACGARLRCQVGQQHLEGPLQEEPETQMSAVGLAVCGPTCGSTYGQEAVEVREVKRVSHLSQDVQGQLPLIGRFTALIRRAAQSRGVAGVERLHQELQTGRARFTNFDLKEQSDEDPVESNLPPSRGGEVRHMLSSPLAYAS